MRLPTTRPARPRRRWQAALAVVLAAGVGVPLQLAVAPAASAEWTAGANLLPAGQQVLGEPVVRYDASGRGYLMHTRYVSSFSDELHLRERPPGGPWGPDQVVVSSATTGTYLRSADMDVNAAGDVVVTWRGNAIHAMRRAAGGSWGPMASWNSPGTQGPANGCPNTPSVGIGDDGTAAVSWTSYQSCNGNVTQWRVMAAAFDPSTGWEGTTQVWDVSDSDVHSRPAVGVDVAGRVTVAFNARNGGFNDALWTAARPSGSWQAPELRGGWGSAALHLGPDVETTGATTSVAWHQDSSVYSTTTTNGSGWTGATNVGFGAQSSHVPPSVAVDEEGTVHVGWTRQSGSVLEARITTLAGGTATHQVVSPATTNALNVQIASGGDGDLAATWDELTNGAWRAVSALRPAGEAWPAPSVVTTTAANNTTQPRIAMDSYGHALVAAVPVWQGIGQSVEVLLETRDPVTDSPDPATIAPSSASVGATLTCTAPDFGGTGPFQYSYVWTRDGDAISGATAAAYVVTAADAGLSIGCEVTASNEAGSASAQADPVTVDVTPPLFTTASTLSGTVEAGRTVRCVPGAVTGAPAPELTYEWLTGGTAVDFETSDEYVVGVGDAGQSLGCRVTATNDGGQDVSASAAQTVPAVSGPVAASRPAITGPAQAGIGSALTCGPGTWTGAPVPTLSYGWLRDGALVDDAFDPGYVVTSADAGTTLTCQVTGENVAGESTSTSSNSRIVPPAPTNKSLPVVRAASGAWAVGRDGQCTTGSWSNASSYAFQWLRDGAPIDGATSSLYRLAQVDAGTTLSCTVTASGRGGQGVATSIGKALAPPPAVVTAPAITGTPRPGRALTCARGTWTDATSFAYTWQRNGITLAGATSNRRTVVVADRATTLTCTVTASGPGGSTSVTTAGVFVP